MAKQQHICGACKASFDSEKGYLDHHCAETESTPREVEHQNQLTDGAFSRQAEKALERGEARKSK